MSGERASADDIAASQYPEVLKKIIEDGNYSPDQIYNLDETALYYKAMPKSTYVSKHQKQARGRKLEKSRFTAMFCVNLTGSHKMRPVVVHTAAHPRCYKHLSDMNNSGVYWYKTRNGWMTTTIMTDWLQKHCIPDAQRKCKQLGLPFKMLLIMDNAPSHPHYLQDVVHKNCNIVFLPPRTTSLIQPLDQELIATVKQIYHKDVYDFLRSRTDSGEELQDLEALQEESWKVSL